MPPVPVAPGAGGFPFFGQAHTVPGMNFFESVLLLMLVATLLLQVARRLDVPYPTLLAGAGVAIAAIPGAPDIPIDPEITLPLFLAPVILDAAFDYPLAAVRKLLVPLIVYAVFAVLLTAAAVATVGVTMIGLPLAAAIVLGAIVAPPDAAAATATLTSLPLNRRVDAVLKGESLFNDATALLLYGAALTVQQEGGLSLATGAQLTIAAPGGILFGIAYGWLLNRLLPSLGMSVGATLIQFVQAYLVWIIAEHLHLSPVLALVASAMTLAASGTDSAPRMRVHSFAVWTTVVFLLNVLAFLIMGLQARVIVTAMTASELRDAMGFAAAVVATVVVTRMLIAFSYRWFRAFRFGRDYAEALKPSETFLIGWTGMRGLVTVATASALPDGFPHREEVMLAAFVVVIVTLVFQGLTLAPLIRLLGANRADEARDSLVQARVELAEAGLARIADETGEEADQMRMMLMEHCAGTLTCPSLDRRRDLALSALVGERARLDELRDSLAIGSDIYLQLQEELDWKQLAISSDADRHIDEG